ncbi:MAG TPA: hypothetical protein VEC76_00795 [Streptosporangiaceae bacterium]|nr:hypothetical protein [Streptosporangiaceae bacterium]
MTPIPPWMSRSIAAAVLAAGAVGVALELARVNSPARDPLVVLFLVAAPALAVAGLMRGIDGFARLIVGIAAAIVINTLVAAVMLAAGVWSPRAGLVAVAAISVVGLAVQLSPAGARLAGSRPGQAAEPEPGAGHDPAAPAPAGDAAPSPRGAFRGRRRQEAQQAAVTDEVTVQMSAFQAPAARPPAAPPPPVQVQPARQESPYEEDATVQMPAFSRGRHAAAPRAGPYTRAIGDPPGPAPASAGHEDRPPSGDDSTQQFPTIRGDE